MSLLPTTYKILSNILLSMLTPYARKLLGIFSMDFNATGQLLIMYTVFVKYLRKNRNTMKQCISSIQMSANGDSGKFHVEDLNKTAVKKSRYWLYGYMHGVSK